ncbi:MAG: efflux RND transporter periplasmic adaptor subunit [Candidatus Omnitrophica bacterium]|nr:efflux RND transporter periplasmic adaptor subunit [Candidatus Omnitrophota bacterium]
MKIVYPVMILIAAAMAGTFVSSFSVSAEEQPVHQAKGAYYCPMHPNYTSDKPGSCPICGMDLVKRKEAASPSPAGASGDNGVVITADRQQLIGVRTAKAEVRPLSLDVRASARVVLDQELYAAQSEYLKGDVFASKYWNSGYQKLRKLGMTDGEIKGLQDRRWADQGLIAIGPPDKGRFYRTPYPDSSWVYAAVQEYEVALIQPGQQVSLTALAFPGEEFRGVVAGVAQVLDPQTRTTRVRIRVEDKGRRLRPEMFMTAVIKVDLGEMLAVPAEAVMDSGARQVVYVLENDRFAPREVQLGARAGEFYAVLGGLMNGGTVVTGGNVLIDAESKMRSAL